MELSSSRQQYSNEENLASKIRIHYENMKMKPNYL